MKISVDVLVVGTELSAPLEIPEEQTHHHLLIRGTEVADGYTCCPLCSSHLTAAEKERL
jgi:hypothetical protein